MERYEAVIGMEIHVELKTRSKMFCGCPADWFGKEPNSLCCPVCLGMPGALPVPNRRAVEWCVMLGQALGCTIPLHAKFDRKNYFYPDLPKGYQISQYDQPFALNGALDVDGKTIRIRRVHLEEDTGKLLHTTIEGKPVTLIDFNRSGVPLVEIVTEPDLRSGEDARGFLKSLHRIIRYLGISDADMEKGSMRLEPNISARLIGSPDLPAYKVEVKNINSFSFAKKAIEYELQRHTELLDAGNTPKQETRGWDENKGITISQRSKEEAADYRYFPEPDIPPITWTEDVLKEISTHIKELPDMKKIRYINEYGLSSYDSSVLIDEKNTADYFESCLRARDATHPSVTTKSIANVIINKKEPISDLSPEQLVRRIAEKASRVLLSREDLEPIISRVIAGNPKAVADIRSGKEGPIMYILGMVMKEAKGQADPQMIKDMLTHLLHET